jgi:hypothetical protein
MATLQERRLGYHSQAGLEPGTSRFSTLRLNHYAARGIIAAQSQRNRSAIAGAPLARVRAPWRCGRRCSACARWRTCANRGDFALYYYYYYYYNYIIIIIAIVIIIIIITIIIMGFEGEHL